MVEPTAEIVNPPSSDYKTALLIGAILLVTFIAVYAMIAKHSGGIGGQVSNGSSSSSPNQTGLPGVQSGNSNSLSPSGSVNLQPTSNASQAGSVQ